MEYESATGAGQTGTQAHDQAMLGRTTQNRANARVAILDWLGIIALLLPRPWWHRVSAPDKSTQDRQDYWIGGV